ncbi:hypothetical protein H4696_008450 [Amycolatopsis lexingtonensis]|uniref:Uncharacterized protein n=1 Tax=Amycolatopsis lexingtonensis TaxID=218822 RepID=A0ABR9IDV1_9PSEU|nr:hypothetical protein [Amycolatopsis lexingtonensis]MBE1501350.1 hypothetical protein [Amycolatopsis lexingtonensis]
MTITEFTPNVTPEAIGWKVEPTLPDYVCATDWCDHSDCTPYLDIDGKWYSHKRLVIAPFPEQDFDLEIFRMDTRSGDTWTEGDMKFAAASAEAMSAEGPQHFAHLLYSIFCAGRKVGGAA